MKKNSALTGISLAMLVLLAACKKENTSPGSENNNTEAPLIGGVISAFKDTTTVTEGTVTIQYSRTEACYPSNEIFQFTAVSSGFPADSPKHL